MLGKIFTTQLQEAPTQAYDTSKAAVHHLTKSLARELAPKRITVNVIAPGFVPSKMSAGLANYGADEEAMNKNIPLGRMGKFLSFFFFFNTNPTTNSSNIRSGLRFPDTSDLLLDSCNIHIDRHWYWYIPIFTNPFTF